MDIENPNCIGCPHIHPDNGNCTAVGGFCTAVPAAHCPLIPELWAENEKLRTEMKQVKRAFDGICEYIDSEGFLRKQFCENGNPDLEPCVCPSLKEHPGYIDSDDCEGCDHFCNSWRSQKED